MVYLVLKVKHYVKGTDKVHAHGEAVCEHLKILFMRNDLDF